MPGFDDRLTRELELVAHPADPSQAFERVERKRAHRARLRKLRAASLAVIVIAGTVGGVVVLSKTFKDGSRRVGGNITSVTIEPKANGRIVASQAQQSLGGRLQLISVNPDGSGRQVVPTNVGPAGDPWLPAFSPDGTRVAVAIFPTGSGPRSIWVMNADGSDPTKIAEAANVSQPSWSPDGTRIAYAADSPEGSAIHIVNADGSNDHVISALLQQKDYFSASFSPDGTRLIYDVGTPSVFDIFVMNADGSHVQQLTTTGTDYNPSWSPDGAQIAFTRQGQGNQSDIYVMNADGSNVRQLTNGGAGVTNLNPTWSPDGTKIAYVDSTIGPGPVFVMNADGSDRVTIIDAGVIGITWQPIPITATAAGAGAGVTVSAKSLQFNTKEIDLVAGQASTITLYNQDAGVPHNIAIATDGGFTNKLFTGPIITGFTSTVYRVPALEPGTYFFHCDVHPTLMQGTVVVTAPDGTSSGVPGSSPSAGSSL